MENKECENCGHSDNHRNPLDETIPSFCHHRNKEGHYDCDCKKFKPKDKR